MAVKNAAAPYKVYGQTETTKTAHDIDILSNKKNCLMGDNPLQFGAVDLALSSSHKQLDILPAAVM